MHNHLFRKSLRSLILLRFKEYVVSNLNSIQVVVSVIERGNRQHVGSFSLLDGFKRIACPR